MDFDAISNCSAISNQSDEVRSNVSTLSGLSAYQAEFAELCHLINPRKYPNYTLERCSTPKQDSGCGLSNDDHVSSLYFQLQNALKLNEKYKYDLFNLEKKIELKYNEKIEILLKNNNKLQLKLDNANEQIERLLTTFSSKKNTTTLLDKNFIELEQKYHSLTVQSSAIQYELLECKTCKEECELDNKQLKLAVSELKIDNEAKSGCIYELKEKIAQQYVEIQGLLKNNTTALESLNNITSELECVKKSQEWYKEHLHLCQKEKKEVSNETFKLKMDITLQNEKIETLNVELAKWKHKCDIIELDALREKEKLYKQLESLNCINETKSNEYQLEAETTTNDYNSIVNYYETSIQDLTNEILKVKEYVQEQDIIFKKITKENSELLAKCIILQKTLQQSEINNEELESTRKHLTMELSSIKDKLNAKYMELESSKREIISLQAELKVRREEKDAIENAITIIRQQFAAFKSKYESLKEEIVDKNKQILQLQNDKQKLFMNNNWNICELEKIKEKDDVIGKLNGIIAGCEQEIKEHVHKVKSLETELSKKDDVNRNLSEAKESIVNKHTLEIEKYENVFTQYKVMVTNYETRVNELQQLLNESKTNITELQDNIQILKKEIHTRDSDLSEICNKCTALENKLKSLSGQKESSNINSKENIELDLKKPFSENIYILSKVLEYFIKVSKAENEINNKNYDLKTQEPVDIHKLLNKLNKYLQDNFQNGIVEHSEETNYKITIHKIKSEVSRKIINLEDRMKTLYKKYEDCNRILDSITKESQNNSDNNLQELNILLQVKELEMKEKQKKYETNNRTLLRKVKEHMRGRNMAEKENKYLQDLYNSLSDENNSLKLVVSTKEYEIENLKKMLETYTNINDKLKQSVLKLEDKVSAERTCDMCLEYATALKQLEERIRDFEEEKIKAQTLLMNKEDNIIKLQEKNQEILLQNLYLSNDKNKHESGIKELLSEKHNLIDKINTLEEELRKKQLLVDEMRLIIEQESKKYFASVNEIKQLKTSLDQMKTKTEYLSAEEQILRSTLQSKSEELDHLKEQNSKQEHSNVEKQQESQSIISTLKNHMHNMQVEINSINSEKYFLQRLCNDLKLALKTHASHNKVLKEQINNQSKEKQDFNSLPNILPDVPSTCKYNDEYINELLQQNRAPLQDKPLTQIKGCLDTLRNEISVLQEQIAKKNMQFA